MRQSIIRRILTGVLAVAVLSPAAVAEPTRSEVLAAMKLATAFMSEKVAVR